MSYPKATVSRTADAEGWQEVVVGGAVMGHTKRVLDPKLDGLTGYLAVNANWLWRPAGSDEVLPLPDQGAVRRLAEAAHA